MVKAAVRARQGDVARRPAEERRAMTGGQALVASIQREGVEVVFGLPGVQLDWAFDALYQARDALRVYHTRHEQATSYMADGYARASGRVGTCLVVPGPGLLNAMAGLATAYACSSPVLCIAGQVQSDLIGRERGVLHEVVGQLTAARTVTKWAGRALRPEEIPGLVREAFRQLRSGRPRPVEIEIPPDTLQATAEVELLPPARTRRPGGDPEALERAAEALGRAERPIIFAGGGVLLAGAWEPLRELAEMLQAPVVMTCNGKGAVSDRSYLAQNLLAGRELLPRADVVLVVGTRFTETASNPWGPRAGQTVIQLDVDPEEVGRNYPPTIGIVADADLGLRALVDRVAKLNRRRESREAELSAVKRAVAAKLAEVQPVAAYALAIREELPDDGIIVVDSTQVGYWSWVGFPVYEPRTFLTSGYQGTLGFAYPTALGAQVGRPGAKVVSISGDGGFMYNVQELATAALHGIPVVAIVFNDDAYGNVMRIQQALFDGHVFATELRNPDFVKLAELFGVEGWRAERPEELRAALRAALASGRPALIEVPIARDVPSVFPLIMSGRAGQPWTWPGE